MSTPPRPVLSVILREFPGGQDNMVERAIDDIQTAVANQPGFLGLQHSSRPKPDGIDLVTVFSFESSEHLARWERSPVRNRMVAELDRLSQGEAAAAQFDDFGAILHPAARISRIEIVVILIFWIMLLGQMLRFAADMVMPEAVAPELRGFMLTVLNVLMISYIFLPLSSRALTRFKAWFARKWN